jgi:peptide-methionine (S)-S-oxide reductase
MRPRSLATLFTVAALAACSATASTANLPDPTYDTAKTATHATETAVLAGGCFWGLQAVFEHVHGVKQVWAGYSGGACEHGPLRRRQRRQHRPRRIGESAVRPLGGQLRPTAEGVLRRRSRPDGTEPAGPRHRHAIPLGNLLSPIRSRRRLPSPTSRSSIAAKVFDGSIVTQVQPLKAFYEAESYHQDYARTHPGRAVYRDQRRAESCRAQATVSGAISAGRSCLST